MEKGYVNAPMTGIAWLSSPKIRWFFSRGVELLQRDWFGPWPPYKAAFSAERCRNCWLVCFWHYQRGIPTASVATETPTPPSILDRLLQPAAAINLFLDRMLGRWRGVPMIAATLAAIVILATQPVSWSVRAVLIGWLVYFCLMVAYLIWYSTFRLPQSQASDKNPPKP